MLFIVTSCKEAQQVYLSCPFTDDVAAISANVNERVKEGLTTKQVQKKKGGSPGANSVIAWPW